MDRLVQMCGMGADWGSIHVLWEGQGSFLRKSATQTCGFCGQMVNVMNTGLFVGSTRAEYSITQNQKGKHYQKPSVPTEGEVMDKVTDPGPARRWSEI